MSFFGKFKSNATPASPNLKDGQAKKDATVAQPTALEKHLADLTGPSRLDGSDKFFGFENYSSTCYCNSILQCLYYSAPFRDHVLNFPAEVPANGSATHDDAEKRISAALKPPRAPLSTKPPPNTPGPLAANSPARRPIVNPNTPQAQNTKPDEKDSPEWRKKMLMQSAPMLDMQLDYSDTYGMQESLFTALKDIFEAIISQGNRTGIVSPHKFLEILRKENEMFRSAMHQDAHEFLNLLLNQVVDTVELYSKQQQQIEASQPVAEKDGAMTGMTKPTAITKAATGWVHDLFEGLLVSETRCLTCENTSQRDEAFMDLSVDLEAHSSVTSCLRKFSEEEMLCERNKFHCDNCGGLQEAEKRMKIKRLPRILALHLKRFKYTEDYNRLQKLFHRVSYPFHLRLFNTTDDAEDQDRFYELYSVVVHIGGGPYHGHYVSIIKTQDRGWLLFDDELVEPVSKSYVQNFFGGEPNKTGIQDAKQLACAYVLFYQETTLEAVQKEQEAEAAAAAAASASTAAATTAARNSDVASPASPTAPSSLWTNGLRAMQSVTTPTEEKDDAFGRLSLSQAVSAPASAPRQAPSDAPASPAIPAVPTSATTAATTTPLSPTQAQSPLSPQKSKKDLKRLEKERKQAEKLATKENQKAQKEKMKDAMERRRQLRERADQELAAALEASKMTKAEEDAKVGGGGGVAGPTSTGAGLGVSTTTESGGGEGPGLAHAVTTGDLKGEHGTTPTSGNGGGLLGGRFRHGSISLRQKKGFWGKKEGAPPVPASPVLEKVNGDVEKMDGGAVVREKEEGSPKVGGGFGFNIKRNSTVKEGDEKRNRFSMGRKKSAVFSS